MKNTALALMILVFLLLPASPAKSGVLEDWINVSKAKLFGIDLSEKNVIFTGRRLSEGEFRNMMKFDQVRKEFERLPKPVRITVLDENNKLDDFTVVADGGAVLFQDSSSLPQLLKFNSPTDQEMIRLSHVESDAHEVGLVRLLDSENQELLSSPYLFGEARSLSVKSISEAIMSLLEQYQVKVREAIKEGRPLGYLAKIEISHTHPYFETKFLIRDKTWTFNHLPLNERDLVFAFKTSREAPGLEIVIRAIVPNGYAYESHFLNGHDITTKPFDAE